MRKKKEVTPRPVTLPPTSRKTMPFLNEIAVNIRLHRGLTQTQLAKKMNLSRYRINIMESMVSSITWESFERFCVAMDVIPAITIEDIALDRLASIDNMAAMKKNRKPIKSQKNFVRGAKSTKLTVRYLNKIYGI